MIINFYASVVATFGNAVLAALGRTVEPAFLSAYGASEYAAK